MCEPCVNRVLAMCCLGSVSSFPHMATTSSSGLQFRAFSLKKSDPKGPASSTHEDWSLFLGRYSIIIYIYIYDILYINIYHVGVFTASSTLKRSSPARSKLGVFRCKQLACPTPLIEKHIWCFELCAVLTLWFLKGIHHYWICPFARELLYRPYAS